ncbi:GIY-YIG nuclease family protein [Patescibacteria group bacterium]|nr:GIY-YIG nuclease family protein [Patescibacteria group bacterium]
MVFLYVIESKNKNFRYVGITKDVKKRLDQHNKGYNESTKRFKPFMLILTERFNNYKEARKKEIFLKSGVGRKFLDNLK